MVLVFVLLLAFLVEAILREVDRARREGAAEVAESCPGCGLVTSSDWLCCPRCRHLLRGRCAGCGHTKVLAHRFCPWCGAPAEEKA